MSASPRPNLGGLFNGSTSPERSSSVAGAFEPRLLRQLPAVEQVGEVPPEPELNAGTTSSGVPTSATDAQVSAGQRERWNVLSLIDPIRIVEQYFAFLQAVLDTNRDVAVALTSTVMSLPKRGRSR